MAKGYDRHVERMNTVSGFGRELARRSKSKCELCEASGVKLSVYEIPPVNEEPDIGKSVFLCDQCISLIENFKKAKENDLRFLSEAVWSETPIVKAVAITLLRKIKDKYIWADEILESVYIDEETEELLNNIEL